MHLIDTDICIQFLRGEKKVVDFITELEVIYISVITLAELFFGIYNSKNIESHKKALANFLSDVSLLNTDFSIAHKFGRIKAKLKNQGTFIGDFDIINAAFSLTYNLTLVTRNIKHYEKIDGINIKSV